MKKVFFGIFILTFVTLLLPVHAKALNMPSFPSCEAPEGKMISEYLNGDHGILGQDQTLFGRDRVYKLDDERILQCYCPPEDKGKYGIATVFWKYGENLTSHDIESIKGKGWFYIPSGSLWGLDDDPYVARNYQFTCYGGNGGGGGESTGGQVLGTSTYAAAGNTKELLLVTASSLVLLLSYLALRRNS